MNPLYSCFKKMRRREVTRSAKNLHAYEHLLVLSSPSTALYTESALEFHTVRNSFLTGCEDTRNSFFITFIHILTETQNTLMQKQEET